MRAGLGLYISKCYIDLFGKIAENNLDKACIFKIPLIKTNETEKKSHYCKRR
jgi:hypothetical protein